MYSLDLLLSIDYFVPEIVTLGIYSECGEWKVVVTFVPLMAYDIEEPSNPSGPSSELDSVRHLCLLFFSYISILRKAKFRS